MKTLLKIFAIVMLSTPALAADKLPDGKTQARILHARLIKVGYKAKFQDMRLENDWKP